MIDWHAEQSDKFIGTAAAIASAIAAGAAGTASVVGAHMSSNAGKEAASSQGDAAVKAAQIQADSANSQAAIQAKTAADALNYSRGQSQLSLDQYNQQQTRLQPYRNLGSFALGQPLQGAPAPLTLPNLPGTQTTPTSGLMPSGSQSGASAGQGDASALKALLDGGMAPQQAVVEFNKKYGRTTGNEAVYYDPSAHGGVATIGLPDAYLAKPGGSWDITQRAGGGGAPAAGATAGPVKLNYTPSMLTSGTSTPTIGTLQAPQYRPLSQIGVQ